MGQYKGKKTNNRSLRFTSNVENKPSSPLIWYQCHSKVFQTASQCFCESFPGVPIIPCGHDLMSTFDPLKLMVFLTVAVRWRWCSGCWNVLFMLLVEVVHHFGNYDFSVYENRILYLLWLTLFCSLESSDLLHSSEFYSAAVLSSVTVFVCCCFFLSSSFDFPLSFKHKPNDKPLDELCNLPKVQTSLIMFKSTPNMPTDLTHD